MKKQPTGGKRLVAYYRYSGGSHQTEQSIEGQRRDCETYARIHGMVILHEYIDRHISGKTDDRPEFQQMIADAGKGMFDYVICWKTDRIARSRYDSIIYKKKLRDNGVELLYAAEANVEGSGGIIVEGLMEALAEYYSAELAEKVRRGMRESALKGKAIGSSRPLGLTVDKDKKYIIDPAGAAAVRYIFEQYAAGAASSSIVAHLNEQGLCTSRGNPFNKSSVVRIIQNEVYRGVYVSPKFDVRIEGAVPAIIDDDLWERAQKMFIRNRQSRSPRNDRADYILSGKLFCGECGTAMKGVSGHSSNGEVYFYYNCPCKDCHRRNIPKDELEGLVIRTVCNDVLQPDVMDRIADSVIEAQTAELNQPNPEKEALQHELADVQRKAKNLLSALENGTAGAMLTNRLAELEQQADTLSYQLSSLESEPKFPVFSKEEVLYLLEQFLIAPSEKTKAYRRRLIDTFVSKIEVSNTELTIYFNIAEEDCGKMKKAPQSNQPEGCSTEKQMVHLLLPQSNFSIFILPTYFYIAIPIFQARKTISVESVTSL